LKLKEWLTVADAGRHLAILFGEEVSEADVLRLALDGHLTLSVNFVNYAHGRCGTIVPFERAKIKTIPDFLGDGTIQLLDDGLLIRDDEVLEFKPGMVRLEGVWDLPMLGAERLDIEHRYQALTGGPAVSLVALDGPLVCAANGIFCRLEEHFDRNPYSDPKNRTKPWNHEDNFYPAPGLPEDCVLVVRTSALRALASRISEPDQAVDRPIERRERATLLVMVAALAKLARVDVSKPSSAASAIESQTALMGARVAARTIENHLKRIPDALDDRRRD
jgi:hypothetical protein